MDGPSCSWRVRNRDQVCVGVWVNGHDGMSTYLLECQARGRVCGLESGFDNYNYKG